MVRLKLAFTFMLICGVLAAQDDRSSVAGQSQAKSIVQEGIPLSFSVEKTGIMVGDRFSISLRVPSQGFGSPTIEPLSIDPRLSVSSSPLLINESSDADATARKTPSFLVRWQLRALMPGWARVQSVQIRSGGKTYRTEPFLIGISNAKLGGKIPPDLVWDSTSFRVNEGETSLISLCLEYPDQYTAPVSFDVIPDPGIAMEEAKGSGVERSEVFGATTFKLTPLSSWLFTPSDSGVVNLPVAHCLWQGSSITVQSASVRVDPLPESVSTSGAIGSFRSTAELSTNAPVIDEQFQLTFRIEGEGNLKFLRMSEPKLTSFILVASSENAQFVTTSKGYRGYREVVYRLVPTKVGPSSIRIPEFAYIAVDERREIQRSPAINLDLDVKSRTQKNPQLGDDATRSVLDLAGVSQYRSLRLQTSLWAYLAFLPALILLVLAIFPAGGPQQRRIRLAITLLGIVIALAGVVFGVLSNKDEPEWSDNISRGASAYATGNYAGAYNYFVAARAIHDDQAGLEYNLAISSWEKGSKAQAVFYAHRAASLQPGVQLFGSVLHHYEDSLGLKRQHQVTNLPSPDLLFLISLCGITLGSIGIFFLRYRISAVRLLLIGLLTLAGIASFVVGVVSYQGARHVLPVVADAGGRLRKIPDARASEWLYLDKGTSLELGVNSGDFWLVDTSYGIKGWIDRSALFPDPRESE